MMFRIFFAVILACCSVAQILNNIDSLRLQNQFRAVAPDSVITELLISLTSEETDFITRNLNHLQEYNGTLCEKCHYKMKYAQLILEENPDKPHLISLMLYENCLALNDNDDSSCEFLDFLVTTNTYDSVAKNAASGPSSAFDSATSVNFYDNDFLLLIRNMNVSSNLTLDYYCHYKGKYCDLPVTPEVSEIFDLDSMWPKKEAKCHKHPEYKTSGNVFNVLHMSDFHNELRFQLGAEADCSQGLCCLPESYNSDLTDSSYNFTEVYESAGASQDMGLSFYEGSHYDENNTFVKGTYHDFPESRGWNWAWTPASTFGNYQCDPPEVLLNNSLFQVSQFAEERNFEFSLFTGDIVDHDVIHCDANVTKFAETRSYKIMKHFLKDMPIFPTLGNHDTFPYGQLAPYHLNNVTFDESTYHWNEDEMTELWMGNGWFNKSENTKITQHYAGFSTTTSRGLKVISLNSNCYYQKNLYSYIDVENQPDLFGQWKFLIDELVESERNNQRVWILAHIPAGDYDTLPIQSNIFAKIVERFSPYTIASIFYGHTHRDQFKILHSEEQVPINMAWISQAITPLGPANPSWRYYEVEDESFNIINAYNYYSPLNETWVNGPQEPKWEFEYSPRAAYDPENEWPASAPLNATFWDEFVLKKLANLLDVSFHQKYTDYLYRINPYVPDCKNGSLVTGDCYEDNYCYNLAFVVDDYDKCVNAQ
ncbi:hypothetical protein METBIDRAFT_214799 [Metschnikowia bicuspidata var. bicuspidata NRRL YB-4993]|uniref:Calcineurin-like phosphoesterase domain-containing protein n=1 Tax=Metschnikowia bicuspidata var. bicuspidata NRRL YB-4993 TaxID=869754 RepID=A0A1A0H5X7_9ASCO|nr:hypothetical protein METBIDRAFT_214799 [Metschnikowia bicuspidata var. bicuspidata NRRL YB-4993]OBA19489.1 hypothetical protein METBIDRAFT_214799 [Metschnikowia bicuspidata var. bicuspidata NRRL YB-4993]